MDDPGALRSAKCMFASLTPRPCSSAISACGRQANFTFGTANFFMADTVSLPFSLKTGPWDVVEFFHLFSLPNLIHPHLSIVLGCVPVTTACPGSRRPPPLGRPVPRSDGGCHPTQALSMSQRACLWGSTHIFQVSAPPFS